MRAMIHVRLKPGVLDPQGKAVESALARLGFGEVKEVRQGKVFDIVLDQVDKGVEQRLEEMCERLLANTVIEEYRIAISDA